MSNHSTTRRLLPEGMKASHVAADSAALTIHAEIRERGCRSRSPATHPSRASTLVPTLRNRRDSSWRSARGHRRR